MKQLENSKQPIANKILNKLKNTEPTLTNAGQLTSDILAGIQDNPEQKPGLLLSLSLAYRILAAACISLLVLMGIEEYVFFDKVKSLEEKSISIAAGGAEVKGLVRMVSLNAIPGDDYIEGLFSGKADLTGLPLDVKIRVARLHSVNVPLGELRKMAKMRGIVYKTH